MAVAVEHEVTSGHIQAASSGVASADTAASRACKAIKDLASAATISLATAAVGDSIVDYVHIVELGMNFLSKQQTKGRRIKQNKQNKNLLNNVVSSHAHMIAMSNDEKPLTALAFLEWDDKSNFGVTSGSAAAALAAVALSSLISGSDESREVALRGFRLAGGGSARPLYLSVERLLAGALAAGVSEAKVVRAAERLGARASDATALAESLPAARSRAGAAARAGAAVSLVGEGGLLKDFDWSVEHVASSDSLRALGEARLTLRLDIGMQPPALAELALPELDALIAELERALGASPRVQAAASGSTAPISEQSDFSANAEQLVR